MTQQTIPSAPAPQPAPRRGLLHLIAEHNPFYLISASCMLFGCLLLTNSLSWDPIAVRRLLTLIVTLNVYEFALVGIGLYLIARRGLKRDGWMLLVLEAFFLVDVTFLNAEIVTAQFGIGVIVNVILFAVAIAKFYVIVRVLRPTVTPAQVAYVLIQLLVLFAMPCVLRRIDHGSLTAGDFYVLWWGIGLLPAAYELLDRLSRPRHHHHDERVGFVRTNGTPTMLYLVLPYFGLLLHVSILHYVYDVRFFGADAAPVLLGLAVVANRLIPLTDLDRRRLLVLRMTLPMAAILVSWNSPALLGFSILGSGVSTLKLTLFAAYLAFVYFFFIRRALYYLTIGGLTAVSILFGPTPSQTVSFVGDALRWMFVWLNRVVPRTASEWGVVGLAAAFGFLILGFAISLLKQPQLNAVEASAPPQRPEVT